MPDDEQLEAFLTHLSTNRGFDFTAYKRGTLSRRIQKRMEAVGSQTYSDYTDFLELHPEEFTLLFDAILINVTDFFRDQPAWDVIRSDVVPGLVERKQSGEPIRIWSAGCATGQETYSIAMLLAEALGAQEFRERVKIYGSDIDEDALNVARHATYTAKAVANVPPELRDAYFERAGDDYAFRKDLRRVIVFGRLDLLQDAPISRVDLLICRNTLMYFNTEAQARVMSRLLFALANGGTLFLGKAETLNAYTSTLTPVDLKLRIFTKVPRLDARQATARLVATDGNGAVVEGAVDQMRAIAFESDPVPQFTVDSGGRLMAINERARQLFVLRETDIGKPLSDLDVSYKPADLRSLIEQAARERRPVALPDIEWLTPTRGTRWYSIHVQPLEADGAVVGLNVIFVDITRTRELQQALEQSRHDLETAYEELQSTNEELETTNEELQSTVEELETTNEELQSTNEELETMNEELQSTNEELETVNMDIRERGHELNRANAFLDTILSTLRMGVAVVSPDLTVQAWNSTAEDLWGVRTSEVVGSHFLNLDIGLPLQELRQNIRDCIAGTAERAEQRLEATNRRGRRIECAVTCIPFRESGEVTGAVLLMEEIPRSGAK